MPTGYQIADQDRPYYLTLQVVAWVDIFTRKIYRDIIVDALNYCIKNKHLEIYGYVIMSNHVHLIAHSMNENLSGTLRDFKSFTSKEILKVIEEGNESREKWMLSIFKNAAIRHKRNSDYQFWTHENHAMEIFSYNFFEQKLDYIHENPVRAGLVENPEEYIYSSAKNYAGEKGLVQVEAINRIWKTVR
jgi:REP element-mobilizing transposase RayT